MKTTHPLPDVVDRAIWQAEVDKLLVREKAHLRQAGNLGGITGRLAAAVRHEGRAVPHRWTANGTVVPARRGSVRRPFGLARIPPAQHSGRRQGEPFRRLALGCVDVEPHASGVRCALQPRAVRLTGRLDHLDRLRHPGVRRHVVEPRSRAKVVGGIQNAVDPTTRIDELVHPRADGISRRQSAKELALQHVSSPERRAVDPLAVPTAIGQLMLEEPVDDAGDVGAEPHPVRDGPGVDAAVDLAGPNTASRRTPSASLRRGVRRRHAYAESRLRFPTPAAN